MSTQLFPGRKESRHHPYVCRTTPTPPPNMYAVPQGHSGRLTVPFLKPTCVAVVRLPQVTSAMELFYSSLRSACQQASSNCYIFSWQEETDRITSRDVAQ